MSDSLDLEAAFTGQLLHALAENNDELALRALTLVAPDSLENATLRDTACYAGDRYAAGEPIDLVSLGVEIRRRGGDLLTFSAAMDQAFTSGLLLHYAEQIDALRRQKKLIALCETAAEFVKKAGPKKGRDTAERLAHRLMELYADRAHRKTKTVHEMLDDEIAAISAGSEHGIPLPWPALDEQIGPLMPGELVGLSGYSGGGKSTLAANLVAGWCRRGFPVIVFPTEMKQQWVARLLAAEADIPQAIAEKRRWKHATPYQQAAYEEAAHRAKAWPWEVVDKPDVSVAEVIGRTRILRKRWPGEHVIVVVDHIHRLNYGGEDPNEQVGAATQAIKNFCGEDTEGGLTFVCLLQPKKPAMGNTYKPVAGHETRGDSRVWNELDIHISPFRMWVETMAGTTPWGTDRTLLNEHDRPVFAKKPNAPGTKLDDEHLYIMPDKRRVGGEGRVVILPFTGPSGRIYELDHHEARGVA